MSKVTKFLVIALLICGCSSSSDDDSTDSAIDPVLVDKIVGFWEFNVSLKSDSCNWEGGVDQNQIFHLDYQIVGGGNSVIATSGNDTYRGTVNSNAIVLTSESTTEDCGDGTQLPIQQVVTINNLSATVSDGNYTVNYSCPPRCSTIWEGTAVPVSFS